MSELPTGWEEVELGRLCQIVRGITFPASAKVAHEAQGYVCCLRTTNVQDAVDWDDIYFVPRKFVKRDDQFVRPGDILMSMANSYELVGKVAVATEVPVPSAFGAFLSAIRPLPGLDGKFLYYLLKSPFVQSELRRGSSQTVNIANISVKTANAISVPIAPPSEQRRIVEKLDSVLSRARACRGHLERVPQILKRFRGAVLEAAVSGRLTEGWRKGAAPNLQSVTIGDLLLEKPRNGFSPKSVDYQTSVKSLTLTATTSGRFRPEHFKYIDETIPKDSHLWLRPGDILVQRANTLEYVGTSAIYDGPIHGHIYPDLMMKCRANSRVLPEYLQICLSSRAVRDHFRKNATGTAGNMPKINQKTVISAPAFVPPLEEQAEIIRRSNVLRSAADRAQTLYEAAQHRLHALQGAVLARAFRGELVPQDPGKKPSSEMQERIKARQTETESGESRQASVIARGRGKRGVVGGQRKTLRERRRA